ncbi:DUF805 domain-containing protein [Salmonella enterica]|nr:DUF805 domain-containing protein [Salmonella enterica]EBH8769142.1 DUF805 domain-containing protein [Salmonella enterica subsp. enterica serovar Freetown]EBU9565728.1 DUF805 domain-containing protein [Salmonella enterica subsp. enterica serovar London]EBY8607844.1 DUF805 domain-containing protein [Salmonella enterica subsp. enterica serovar Reading]EBZ4432171.1 DUF805 domain-containing protein [Salmonella enterica subsp. enterica serovar Derby]ECB6686812.1 DUF805 domain-containing protein [
MNWYLHVLKNYATFSGRARRKEYWMFVLVNIIIASVLGIIQALTGIQDTPVLTLFYSLAVLIPSISVLVRRLHDTGRSGYFAFLLLIPFVGGIVILVFMCQKGTDGDNKFGCDPLGQAGVN